MASGNLSLPYDYEGAATPVLGFLSLSYSVNGQIKFPTWSI